MVNISTSVGNSCTGTSTRRTSAVGSSWASPPYVTPRLVEALQDRPDFRLIEMDCHHMVPLARPAETAQLIRERLS